MDNRQFAEGYIDGRRDREQPLDPEMAELVTGPRKWASFFNEMLDNYLNDVPIDAVESDKTIVDYLDWHISYFNQTLNRAKTIASHDDEVRMRHLSELNFHTMNSAMLPMWQLLSQPETQLNHQYLQSSQTMLAMQSAPLMRERSALKKQEDSTGEKTGMVLYYNGVLTEIDTAITLIELMKQDRDGALVVVPAPQQFESGRQKRNNVDLVVIDRTLKQARGIQAKTRVMDDGTNNDYNRARVTTIDGFYDLGNSVAVRRDHGSGMRVTSQPGLIALDHLQRVTTKDVPFGMKHAFIRNELMRSKSIARELSRKRKSFIPQATRQVKEKVLHDLYMAPDHNPAVSRQS